MCYIFPLPLTPPFALSLPLPYPVPPSLIIPTRYLELRFKSPAIISDISYFLHPGKMLCQWPTPYHLGGDLVHSAQHEYQFPTIIQLDEVAPPPPSSQKAILSPVPSSSQSYDYFSSSSECEDTEDEEEEEAASESYCSSDLSTPVMEDLERASATVSVPVEQKAKMSRVMAWRNSFDSMFAEENAGMCRSCFLPHSVFRPITFSPLATSPCSTSFGPRVPSQSLIILPRAVAFNRFFSRTLLSPAALTSLKRKYMNEPEDGESGEDVVQQCPLADAVSPSSPIIFSLFSQFITRPFRSPPRNETFPTLPRTRESHSDL